MVFTKLPFKKKRKKRKPRVRHTIEGQNYADLSGYTLAIAKNIQEDIKEDGSPFNVGWPSPLMSIYML